MRILIYSQFFATAAVGGMQTFTRELADYLNENNQDVWIASESHEPLLSSSNAGRDPRPTGELLLSCGKSIGIYTIPGNVPYWVDTYLWGMYSWSCLLKHLRPDIIHFVFCFPDFSILPILSHRTAAKTVVTIQCAYAPGAQLLDEELTGIMGTFLGRGLLFIDDLLFSLLGSCDVVTAVSKELSQTIAAFIQKEVRHIPNPVDTAKFSPGVEKYDRSKLGINDSDKVIVFVGRMNEQKGIHVLVDAFEKLNRSLPETKLLLVGQIEGQIDESKFRRLIEHGSIVVMPVQPPDLIPSILASADIFVLPSLTEAMSISLIEAMACGKCVVASDILGMREVIDDQISGLLLKPGNGLDLCRKLSMLVQDDELRQRLGQEARKKAESFEKKKILSRYLDIHMGL